MKPQDADLSLPQALSLPVVLVVDDELRSQEAMRRTLDDDFQVLLASDAAQASAIMDSQPVDIVLCDQRMPGQTGVEFLKQARERWPDAVRILVSGYTDSQDIITGINEAGIFRYVLKPWTPAHLLGTVKSAHEATQAQHSLHRLELDLRAGQRALGAKRQRVLGEVRRSFQFDRIVRAPGSPLDALCSLADRIARHDLSVLILGESGTGKELMARAIHFASQRMAGPFVVENCAALADTLLESELFGHKRGAFTGAVDDHLGVFQRAHGGTVFLDEIGETSPAFQVKLLRVLQEGEVRPVGAPRPVPVDVRVLAATHRDLEADVRAGRFREDLYYRLAGATLGMPALRERPGDIVPIAEALLADLAAGMGLREARFDDDCRAVMIGYGWPGNIRELRNEIARALALADGPELTAQLLSHRVQQGQAPTLPRLTANLSALPDTGTLQQRLDAVEAMVLREVMLRLRWNKSKAAAELGLSRMGLRAKLIRFRLEDGQAAC